LGIFAFILAFVKLFIQKKPKALKSN
jgi:hypothetical protein